MTRRRRTALRVDQPTHCTRAHTSHTPSCAPKSGVTYDRPRFISTREMQSMLFQVPTMFAKLHFPSTMQGFFELWHHWCLGPIPMTHMRVDLHQRSGGCGQTSKDWITSTLNPFSREGRTLVSPCCRGKLVAFCVIKDVVASLELSLPIELSLGVVSESTMSFVM